MSTFLRTTALSTRGARTLERADYVSADVFAAEHERIFAREWLCVGREEMIAGPGQYVLFEVGPDNLIVVRDRSGTVRALHNTCRHRGTRLCDAPCGELSETIQCPYHAWTYGLDGRLLGVPDPKEMEDFDKADYPLKQAAVALWEGFVFVNLAEEPEPFVEAYAPLISRFGRWNLRGAPRGAAHRLRRAGQLEDPLPELLRVLPLLAGAPDAGEALLAHERRERPHRRPVPRRLHDGDDAGRQPLGERPRVRRAGGGPAGRRTCSGCTTTRSSPTCC